MANKIYVVVSNDENDEMKFLIESSKSNIAKELNSAYSLRIGEKCEKENGDSEEFKGFVPDDFTEAPGMFEWCFHTCVTFDDGFIDVRGKSFDAKAFEKAIAEMTEEKGDDK